jgi:hypothetical protein
MHKFLLLRQQSLPGIFPEKRECGGSTRLKGSAVTGNGFECGYRGWRLYDKYNGMTFLIEDRKTKPE